MPNLKSPTEPVSRIKIDKDSDRLKNADIPKMMMTPKINMTQKIKTTKERLVLLLAKLPFTRLSQYTGVLNVVLYDFLFKQSI